jgi:MFS family permease
MVLCPMAIVGTIGHFFPLMTERGFSKDVASNAMSILYFGGMFGQLSSGWLVDRFNTPRIVLPFFGSALIGLITLYSTSSPVVVLIGAAFLGTGQGSELGLCAYLVSRYFGMRSYGQIYGFIFGAANLGVGLGIMGMGLVHDWAGSYQPMAYADSAMLALAVLTLATLGPYVYSRRPPVEPPAEAAADAIA